MTVLRSRRGVILGGISLAGLGLAGGIAALAFRPAAPLADVRTLSWMDLMPEAERAAQEIAQAHVLAQNPSDPFAQLAMDFDGEGSDAPWQPLPQSNPDAKPRDDLDGKIVALSGYMTPLDFTARETRAFLFVPYVGACIHVPAPPANQIVLVETEEPVPVLDMWQPFTAVGRLRVERLDTGLAESAYVMSLDRMVAIDVSGGPEDYGGQEMN
ncbi:MAG: DUF3299 domain-containing protein [Pseudomonadota bacterium]